MTRNLLLKNIAYSGVALISAFIVYLAPGNMIRSSKDGSGYFAGRIVSCIYRSFLSTFKNVFDWMINPLWICLVILLIFLITQVFSTQILWKNPKIFPITITSLIAALYMSYFTRWYSLGAAGPFRSNSVSYTIFLIITILLTLYLAGNLNSPPLVNYIKTNKIFISIITIFCCLSVAVNYQPLRHDFRVLKKHHKYYQTIYPLVINAKANSDITLTPEPKVKIMRFRRNYLTTNKQHWINKGFSNYFNLNSVISKRESKEIRR